MQQVQLRKIYQIDPLRVTQRRYAGENNDGLLNSDIEPSQQGNKGTSNDGFTGGMDGELAYSSYEFDQNKLLNEFKRMMKKRIPLDNDKDEYDDGSRTRNNVELVRAANANYDLQRNLFNTKY